MNGLQVASAFTFGRIDYLYFGHCAKGKPEAITGLWDTDTGDTNENLG
jgi:hypothetical protein